MKKAVFIVIALCLFSMVVFAHPGRTDSNGGHWNRETGEYHFHDGRYAGKNSSSNSSSSDNSNFVPPYDPPTNNPYNQETVWQKTKAAFPAAFWTFIAVLFTINAFYLTFNKEEQAGCTGIFFLVICAVVLILAYQSNARACIITAAITLFASASIYFVCFLSKKTSDEIGAYESALSEYEDFLSRKETLATAPVIPNQYEIGDDNLPKEKGAEDWGKSLTFYKSLSGKKLHQKYNCGNATTKVHLFQYRNYRNLKGMLCKNCSAQNVPEMRWYSDFLKYQKAQEGFAETLKKSESTYNTIIICRKRCNSMGFSFLLLFSKTKRAALNDLNNRSDNIMERRFVMNF